MELQRLPVRSDPSPKLDVAAEIERIDRVRAQLHRQWNTPVRLDWKGVVLTAGLGALIFVAGAIFALQVGM